MSRTCLLACLLILALPVAAQSPPVRLTFVPVTEEFTTAAREYAELWAAEGTRIVAILERLSGLRFISPAYADTAIVVQVAERPAASGFRTIPMIMRASYPAETRRATLMHELGHRLQSGLFRRGEEEHGPLFLWLYDAWVELDGEEMANRQVAVEQRRGGPYPSAWDAAMAMSREERARRWTAIRDERLATRRPSGQRGRG